LRLYIETGKFDDAEDIQRLIDAALPLMEAPSGNAWSEVRWCGVGGVWERKHVSFLGEALGSAP